MIYFRSSVLFALSISCLTCFSSLASPQDSKPNNLLSSKLISQTVTEDTEITQINSNKMLLLLAMGATSVVAATTLFFVLQPESQPDTIKSDTETPQKPEPQKPIVEISPSTVVDRDLTATNEREQNLNLSPDSKKESFLSSNFSQSKPLTKATPLVNSQNQDGLNLANDRLTVNFNNTIISYNAEDNYTDIPSQTKSIDLIFELIQDLQHSNEAIRRKAIWELAQQADSRAIAPLIKLMPQVNSKEKSSILKAITQITSRSLKSMNQVLLNSFNDASPQVRKNAIRDSTLLCQLNVQVMERLSQLVEDADPEVRQTARWAREELNSASNSNPTALPEIVNNQDNLLK